MEDGATVISKVTVRTDSERGGSGVSLPVDGPKKRAEASR
ncbi:hypothetical protein Hlac_2491 [Halorubrum lacusprofundi ATCC 49239]|jgi:hypothetical protein|uniref:Uncharacterized protein n=1 Tax=Halorubrum lacusprofundi (strain ATCC 49239 / DSM 5036 / JCM 8891 / ACAM 34) TaxID=416348 RepID=B9LT92_HALLT|nr:hypothetical protein Hlac_2491 [Halorubrum lacusprofundi ATCC 49239]